MIRNKKIFNGGIDSDNSLELLDDAKYLRIMNGRVGNTQYGRNNRVENSLGTTAIANTTYPSGGTNMNIGSCIDTEGQRLLWANYNSAGNHGIYCYDLRANIVYAVLYNSQVTGGLNFSKDYRIDRNCKVINGLFYFSDNLNEPKKVNIDSGIKLNQSSYTTTAVAYTSPLDSSDIALIKRPPTYNPTIEKLYNGSYVNNFIATNSWQFAWQYIYFDGETSVLGEFSVSSKMNLVELGVAEVYNYINCKLSLNEIIPQTVRILRLVSKNQLTNGYNVIKTYDKLIDSTSFTNHNNGTTQISFDYYGDIIGETISDSDAVKPYDSVPLLSKTLESATSRLFLGNNLEGYTAPTSTSLSYSQTSGTVISSPLTITRQDGQTGSPPSITGSYKLLMTGTPQIGDIISLLITVSDTTQSPTVKAVTINYTVASTNILTVEAALRAAIVAEGTTSAYHITVTDQSSPDPLAVKFTTNTGNSKVLFINPTITYISPTTANRKFFKNESSYQLGITFYDKARRKSGIVTNSGLIFQTPQKTYTNNTATLTVNWALSNTNALTEIPTWAYYYSICRTLNLKTRYFIDSLTSDDFYANKNSSGVYEYTKKVFDTTVVAVAIDTTTLLQSKLGYTYTDGDVCLLINSSTGARNELRIIGTDGKYILLSPKNIGDLTTASFSIEIYTPYIKLADEPFYEVGNIYPITNAGLSGRVYSTLSGTLDGDTFIFQRLYNSNGYYVEAMSPNDDYYKNWFTDAGFINYVTLLGQKRNEHEIRYSNVYATGTQNNGLSTFEALNYKTTPLGLGAIQKLQLASKTSEQGVIMLAICTLQTASCYLGEVQLVGSSANSSLVQDTAVIGTINVLKGMFGTTSPESVVEYLGNVFWYDLNNGAIVQYASNGLSSIGSFGNDRLFKNYAKGYLATSSATLDTLNGFHHLPTFIDPFHREFNATLIGLIAEGSASVLPSYDTIPSYASSIINRFDINDNLAKTLAFNIIENKWVSDFQFIAEQYDYFENRLFAFKNGTLYEMNTNSSSWNTWFGTQYPLRMCWVVNKPVSSVKDLYEMSLEGSNAPNFTVIYNTNPNTQITDLTIDDFTNREGVFYASLFRDRLSPNTTGDVNDKLLKGDIMVSQVPLVMTEFQQYSSLIYINFVNTGFNVSRGQNSILIS
jgi:hypothetical protein